MTGLTEQFHREPRDTVAAFGADALAGPRRRLRRLHLGRHHARRRRPTGARAPTPPRRHRPPQPHRRRRAASTSSSSATRPGGSASPSCVDGRLPDRPRRGRRSTTRPGSPSATETQIGEHSATWSPGRPTARRCSPGCRSSSCRLDAAQDAPVPRPAPRHRRSSSTASPTRARRLHIARRRGDRRGRHAAPRTVVSSVNLIRVLLWFVAAMIIGTMTYLSALERLRDMAVLKAIGASTRQLGSVDRPPGRAHRAARRRPGRPCSRCSSVAGVPARGVGAGPGAAPGAGDRGARGAAGGQSSGCARPSRVDPALAFAGPGA